MEKLACDLHIHSCLSPCAQMDMTPNNIVRMAMLKGLDAIAVCDHNCAWNLSAIKAVADACGLLLLPGVEAQSSEEVHLLCYFPTVCAAEDFSRALYETLPDMPNMPDFFGEQAVLDENDALVRHEERLLIQSSELTIDELAALCASRGGVSVPAHINRTANSLLYLLGFMPESPSFSSVELMRNVPLPRGFDPSPYHVLYSSDAHSLEDILEREFFLNAGEKSVQALLKYIGSKKAE
ncbi:MAG: hypothetical protein ABFC62_03700 [Clostridiaceae bacterium]